MLKNPRDAVGAAAGAVPGAVLGVVFGAAARLRNTKPLHPYGRVGPGVLEVTHRRPGLGVPLLEAEGEHDCVVRWSRSTGLPAPLPDIEGLAVRLEEPRSDLLFAATGTGGLTRFLLTVRAPDSHGPQGTLLPVGTAGGPMLFLATPVLDRGDGPPERFVLSLAVGTGDWERWGRLDVVSWGPDLSMRFDPVRNPLPGTWQYPWVRFLREPAYLMARFGASSPDAP